MTLPLGEVSRAPASFYMLFFWRWPLCAEPPFLGFFRSRSDRLGHIELPSLGQKCVDVVENFQTLPGVQKKLVSLHRSATGVTEPASLGFPSAAGLPQPGFWRAHQGGESAGRVPPGADPSYYPSAKVDDVSRNRNVRRSAPRATWHGLEDHAARIIEF